MRPLGSFNMELFGIEVLFAGSLVLGAYTIIKLLTGDGSSPNVANANQAIIPGSARLLSEGDTAAFKGHTIRRKVLTTEEVPYDQPVGAGVIKKYLVNFDDGSATYLYSKNRPTIDGNGFLAKGHIH